MPLAQVHVRIDDELKKRADEAMKLAGTTPTQAITLFYQYIAENNKLPFSVRTFLVTTDDTTRKIIEDLKGIFNFCSAVFEASLKGKKSNGIEVTMSIAGQLSSVQSHLTGWQTNFSDHEVEQVNTVLNSLFEVAGHLMTISPNLITISPSEEMAYPTNNILTQRILDDVGKTISAIEINYFKKIGE
ncbi:hypothetical protein F164LOC_18355 [Pectobacterium carotovorum]|nr:hypothetical protein F164LOC_18355 [Pectobacterium carotovorum]